MEFRDTIPEGPAASRPKGQGSALPRALFRGPYLGDSAVGPLIPRAGGRRDRQAGRGTQPLRREQSHPPEVVRLPAVNGEGGIRTLDAPFGHARDFQSRSFGQLGHLSALDGAYRRRQDPATLETYAATSWICWGVNVPLNEGIGDLPFVTRSTTLS